MKAFVTYWVTVLLLVPTNVLGFNCADEDPTLKELRVSDFISMLVIFIRSKVMCLFPSSLSIEKAHIRCTVDETGQECQDYFDLNPIASSECPSDRSPENSPYKLAVTYEWKLCNTNQKERIDLKGKSIQAKFRQDFVTYDTLQKSIRQRKCIRVSKKKKEIDLCTLRQPYLKLSVESGGKTCVEQRVSYQVKLKAECKDKITVSIIKTTENMLPLNNASSPLFAGDRKMRRLRKSI